MAESQWMTVNVKTDDVETLKKEVRERAEATFNNDKLFDPVFVEPDDSEIDLYFSVFMPEGMGSYDTLRVYEDFCLESSVDIDLLIGAEAADTGWFQYYQHGQEVSKSSLGMDLFLGGNFI